MRGEEHRDPSLTGPPGISEVSPPEEATSKRSQGKHQVYGARRPVMERGPFGVFTVGAKLHWARLECSGK